MEGSKNSLTSTTALFMIKDKTESLAQIKATLPSRYCPVVDICVGELKYRRYVVDWLVACHLARIRLTNSGISKNLNKNAVKYSFLSAFKYFEDEIFNCWVDFWSHLYELGLPKKSYSFSYNNNSDINRPDSYLAEEEQPKKAELNHLVESYKEFCEL